MRLFKRLTKWIAFLALALGLMLLIVFWNAQTLLNYVLPADVTVSCLQWRLQSTTRLSVEKLCLNDTIYTVNAKNVQIGLIWKGLKPQIASIDVGSIDVENYYPTFFVFDDSESPGFIPDITIRNGRWFLAETKNSVEFSLSLINSGQSQAFQVNVIDSKQGALTLDGQSNQGIYHATWLAQLNSVEDYIPLLSEFDLDDQTLAKLSGFSNLDLQGSFSGSIDDFESLHRWRFRFQEDAISTRANFNFTLNHQDQVSTIETKGNAELNIEGLAQLANKALERVNADNQVMVEPLSHAPTRFVLPRKLSFNHNNRRISLNDDLLIKHDDIEVRIKGADAFVSESSASNGLISLKTRVNAKFAHQISFQGVSERVTGNTDLQLNVTDQKQLVDINRLQLKIGKFRHKGDRLIHIEAPVITFKGNAEFDEFSLRIIGGVVDVFANELVLNGTSLGRLDWNSNFNWSSDMAVLSGVTSLDKGLRARHRMAFLEQHNLYEMSFVDQSAERLQQLFNALDLNGVRFDQGQFSLDLEAIQKAGELTAKGNASFNNLSASYKAWNTKDFSADIKFSNVKLDGSANASVNLTGPVYLDEALLFNTQSNLKAVMQESEIAVSGNSLVNNTLKANHHLNINKAQLSYVLELPKQPAANLNKALDIYLAEDLNLSNGEILLQINGDDSHARVQSEFGTADGTYGDFGISGWKLDLQAELDQAGVPEQRGKISFDLIDVGIPIKNVRGDIVFDGTISSPELRVENVQGEILNGRFLFDAYQIYPNVPQQRLLTLDNVDLAELMTLHEQPGIVLQGKIGGELPILFSSGSVRIVQGKLNSQNKGKILLKDNAAFNAIKQQQADIRPVLEMLENLDVESISSEIDMNQAGELDMKVAIKGVNPDKKQPIHFNYTHKENLFMLLKTLRIGDELTEAIEKKLEKKEP